MKTKTSLLTLALCFAAGTFCFASPQMGTWKLNEAKSKFAPGTGKNTMVVYKDAMGGKVKITTDGVDANGKPTHGEWTGKFDGKDYPVTGDPMSDTRSYTKVDDRTLDFSVKKRWKGHDYWSGERSRRWQEPHCHHHWDEREGQEVQQHGGLRQEVIVVQYRVRWLVPVAAALRAAGRTFHLAAQTTLRTA